MATGSAPRSSRHPFRKTLFAVALGALLAGCGGGGETGTTDDPTLSLLDGAPTLEAGLAHDIPAVAGPAPAPGSDPVAGTPPPDPAPMMVQRTVTPSLGQVFSGTVRVIAPGGGGLEVAELARADRARRRCRTGDPGGCRRPVHH